MKNFKSLAALTAASMISLASVATPIFANEYGEEAKVSTYVNSVDGFLPASTPQIKYQIEAATDATGPWQADAAPGTVFNGVEGAFTITNAVLVDNDASDKAVTYSQSTVTCVNLSVFAQHPGVYKYYISAETMTDGGVQGMTLDDTKIPMNVLVGYNDSGVFGVISYTFGEGDAKTTNPTFTHVYDTDPLAVTKTVTGNQGDRNQEFEFTVNVKKPVGQQLQATNADGKKVQITEKDNGTCDYTFTLKHGERFELAGLTGDNKYTVTEKDAGGYTTTYVKKVGEVSGETQNGLTTGEVDATNALAEEVAFTNDKRGNVPTGILMTAAPYVAVVGLGGVFAGMFFRRKRED